MHRMDKSIGLDLISWILPEQQTKNANNVQRSLTFMKGTKIVSSRLFGMTRIVRIFLAKDLFSNKRIRYDPKNAQRNHIAGVSTKLRTVQSILTMFPDKKLRLGKLIRRAGKATRKRGNKLFCGIGIGTNDLI
jgi:hypothetical protein